MIIKKKNKTKQEKQRDSAAFCIHTPHAKGGQYFKVVQDFLRRYP